jgi:fucose permease
VGGDTARLFFYVGSELTYGNWISTYAIEIKLANPAEAAYLTSAFWVALTAGRLISIPVSFRLKAKTILWVAMIGSFICVGLTLAAPSSPVVLWIATAGAGFFLAPIFPTVVSVANSVLKLNARLTGIIFFGDSLGAMVLPTAMGQIISGAGALAMMVTLFVSILLLLGVYAVFTRLTVGHRR